MNAVAWFLGAAEPLCSRTRACVYVQLVDHYPYAAIAPKEVLVNPLSMQ